MKVLFATILCIINCLSILAFIMLSGGVFLIISMACSIFTACLIANINEDETEL